MFNAAGVGIMTVDVGGTVQNPGLVADLCKIIERQSQEIANLVHINAPLPVENAPLQPHMSLQITELGRGLDKPFEHSVQTTQLSAQELAQPVLQETPAQMLQVHVGQTSASQQQQQLVHQPQMQPQMLRPMLQPMQQPMQPMQPMQTQPTQMHSPMQQMIQPMQHMQQQSMMQQPVQQRAVPIAQPMGFPPSPMSSLPVPAQPISVAQGWPVDGLETVNTGEKRNLDQRREAARYCQECGVSETPKWRCGMTLCNACGLLAAKRAKRSKSDGTGSLEDSDAESQDTSAMQAAQDAARASARAALLAARAACGASSEPKTVRPSINPAVQRAMQSELSCAQVVAQPVALPSTSALGTLALAPNSPSGSLVEERGPLAAPPPTPVPPSKTVASVTCLSTASASMMASNLPAPSLPPPSLASTSLASTLSHPAAGQDDAPATLLSIQQQLTDGSDQDATPSASPLANASTASSPAPVHVLDSTISAVSKPLVSPLCAPGAVTVARPAASAMGAPVQAGLTAQTDSAVQAAAASVAKAASIVRSASSVHAKSLAADRRIDRLRTKATTAFPVQASMRKQPMQPAAQHAIPMANAMLMAQPMPMSHSVPGQQEKRKKGKQKERPLQMLQMMQPVQQQMMQPMQQMHMMPQQMHMMQQMPQPMEMHTMQPAPLPQPAHLPMMSTTQFQQYEGQVPQQELSQQRPAPQSVQLAHPMQLAPPPQPALLPMMSTTQFQLYEGQVPQQELSQQRPAPQPVLAHPMAQPF